MSLHIPKAHALLLFLFSTLLLSTTATVIPRGPIEDKTDKLLFSTSMSDFQPSRSNGDPQLDLTTDGCSGSPNTPSGFNFLPSCERHDFGYRNYRRQNRFTEPNRKKIDDNFKSDMYNECAKYTGSDSFKGVACRGVADVYYEAVRAFGRGFKVGDLDIEKVVGGAKKSGGALKGFFESIFS